MKKITLLTLGLVFLCLPMLSLADIVTPTTTTVYFEKDGKKFDKPIDYTVTCYGYSYPPGPSPEKEPGTYNSEDVYRYTAYCSGYGCTIDEYYYLNYRHIDYCALQGVAEGEEFTIANIGALPYTECNYDATFNRFCESRFDLSASIQTTYSEYSMAGIYNSFWLALLLTIIIETLALWLLLRFVFKKEKQAKNNKKIIFTGVIASFTTLPYIWFVFPQFSFYVKLILGFLRGMPLADIVIGEILVVFIESYIISRLLKIKYKKALLISLIINALSFAMGMIWMVMSSW